MNVFPVSVTQAFWWTVFILSLIGLIFSLILLAWSISYMKRSEKTKKTK